MLFFNNNKKNQRKSSRNSAIKWRNYVMKIKEEKSVCFYGIIEKLTHGRESEKSTTRAGH